MHLTGFLALLLLLCMACCALVHAQDLPDWTDKIRADHPRLFFNTETWPEVEARALGQEREWYDQLKGRVDRLLREYAEQETPEARDLGPQSAWAAFVFLMTEQEQYMDLAVKLLETSLRFYEQCYEERRTVNWYSTSRVHATMTWDWLYNHLTEEQRHEYMSRLVQVIHKVLTVRPRIPRENISGHTTGFYGVNNACWFIGLTALGTGIEEELVHEWLVWGYNENMKMLAHRRHAAGDDGGGASPTLGYTFGAYPWSEQNFFYTWLSATGENIAPNWPHGATLANYIIWNWIETGDMPLEFGYGDAGHTTNHLPIWQLYTHMANIRHLFAQADPLAAALAAHIQDILPERNRGYSDTWFIYPFLLTSLEASPEPFAPQDLPHGRHFENMGQVFMRSGTGPEDTYCLFTCGGVLAQHRHFDALNFVIYHRGHLALDSGTRYKEEVNGQHLANYYAQTVAHNCVLVHQPGEPPARYWGGTVEANHGGQHRQLGSRVVAFETNDRFVYVAGDGTASYFHRSADLPEKVALVTRQIVFLMPNHFVIFDRVVSTDPSYRKEWLIHTAHEPVIDGLTFRADHVEGRMFCRTLLPTDAVLTPVGGPGREFWAAGQNWDIDTGNLTPENLAMMGQWRVEVSPGAERTEDVFLHVIQVGDQALDGMDATELIEGEGIAGVRVRIGERIWEVTFATTGNLAGHIRLIGGGQPLDRPLATEVTPQVGILATAE